MRKLSEIMSGVAEKITVSNSDDDFLQSLQRQADRLNKEEGNLRGLDCPKCLNRGYINEVRGREIVWVTCSCSGARKSLAKIERSGLGNAIKTQTFDTYTATENWQIAIKRLAETYAQSGEGRWFFIGGQSGAGKTHLCTAISGKLLHSGKAVKYMLWCDESTKLKSVVNDAEERDALMDELKKAEVLYIDDFLKTQKGVNPSSADVKLAFEILNYRYANKMMTIISSERVSGDIINIDEALGGRIVEMSRPYNFCIDLSNDRAKNYRIKPNNTIYR